jgi:membrane protease YdiL (CAAX protease family)
VLFLVAKPIPSELMQRTFGANLNSVNFQGILFVLLFAIAEEIIFRLGIQNFLAKHLNLHGGRYWVAIICSTILWSLAHVGTLNPEWVKLAQVVPLGILFGRLCKKYGAESSILAHGLFNVVMAFLGSVLIRQV